MEAVSSAATRDPLKLMSSAGLLWSAMKVCAEKCSWSSSYSPLPAPSCPHPALPRAGLSFQAGCPCLSSEVDGLGLSELFNLCAGGEGDGP